MRPRPRLRKTAKWAGVVVCAVVGGAWVGAIFFTAGCSNARGHLFHAFEGGVRLLVYEREAWAKVDKRFAQPDACIERRARIKITWWPKVSEEWQQQRVVSVDPALTRVTRTTWSAFVPLWIPFLLCAIPTALLWRRDHVLTKRARAGRCPKCGYDRGGLTPDAPCPECCVKPG